MYRVPQSPDAKAIQAALAHNAGLVRLAEMPHPYVLQTMGIVSLGEIALPTYQSGLGADSQQGDHFRVYVMAGNPSEGFHQEEGSLADISGQGQGSLHWVSRPEETYGALNITLSLGETTYNPTTAQDANLVVQQATTDVDSQQGQTSVQQSYDASEGTSETTVTASNPDGEPENVAPVAGENWDAT